MDSKQDKLPTHSTTNPFEFKENPKNSLTIILLSDFHMEIKKLEKLKSWYSQTKDLFPDYLFLMGDFDNIPRKTTEDLKLKIDKIECAKSEGNISNILVFLEFFACEMIYIPGNHDPYSMFIGQNENISSCLPKLTQHSTNIHKEVFKLADGLNLFGFGGSLPGYYREDSREKVWEGFPYSSDEALGKDFEEGISRKSKELSDGQTILVTHIGPMSSSTSIDASAEPDKKVYSGSTFLSNFIKENKYKILTNIHGHTHWGVGQIITNKISVINPGPLLYGCFAILKLVRSTSTKRWSIQSTQFLNLNSFE